MSVNNFLVILARALEARGRPDATERLSIYETSRRTLERFFEQNPSLDAAARAKQRDELKAAIDELERLHVREHDPVPRRTGEAVDPRGETPGATVPPPKTAAAPPSPPRPPPTAPTARTPADVPPAAKPAVPPSAKPAVPPAVKPAAATPPQRPAPTASAVVSEPTAARQPTPPAPAETSVPASPPLAPPVPVGDDPGETPASNDETPSRGSTAAEAAPNKRALPDPRAMEALFGDDTDAPNSSDAPVAAADEERGRNRRGTIVILVLLLALGVAYQSGWFETARRLVIVGTLPKTDLPVAPAAPNDLAATGGWARVAQDRLGDTGAADRTAALLRFEDAAGANRKDLSGQIAWTRTGSGDGEELHGRLTFTGSPITIEILLERDIGSPDGFSRMALFVVEGTADSILEIGPLQRVDPASGRTRDVDGISSRIGLSRILYGYRPSSEDAEPSFERRALLQFSVVLESGQRVTVSFRLPPPV